MELTSILPNLQAKQNQKLKAVAHLNNENENDNSYNDLKYIKHIPFHTTTLWRRHSMEQTNESQR